MNLAIIDDNLLDLKIINHVITKEIEKYKIVYQVDLYQNCLDFDNTKDYDVLFLDIDMPINGIDLAKDYLKRHKRTVIIFISNHDEQFYDAYNVHPYQFIKKTDLTLMIKNLIYELVEKIETDNHIIIKINCDYKKILINHIKYIQSNKHYCIITTINNQYQIREKLNNLEKQINNQCFCRISNTKIINWLYVDEYTNNMIKMGTNYFNISRSKIKAVKQSRINYISYLL